MASFLDEFEEREASIKEKREQIATLKVKLAHIKEQNELLRELVKERYGEEPK